MSPPSAPLDCYDSGLVPAPREAGSMVPRGQEEGRTARLPPPITWAEQEEVRVLQVRTRTSSPSPPPASSPALQPGLPQPGLPREPTRSQFARLSVCLLCPGSTGGFPLGADQCPALLRVTLHVCPPAISRTLSGLGQGRHSAREYTGPGRTNAEAAAAHPDLRLILAFSIGSAKRFSTLLKESNK